MKRIALISDTHGLLSEDVLKSLDNVDEIWHAGDIGTEEVLDTLESIAPLRVVYGNIDDHKIRSRTALDLIFQIEGIKVFMTHIGGYPPRYNARVMSQLKYVNPDLYISGHSHILKVMRDKKRNILHMNPGACGIHGFHKFRTFLMFEIDMGRIANVNVIDLGLRGKIAKE